MHRPLLILDLDETLLYAHESELSCAFDFRIGQYFVYKRPNVNIFIQSVSTAFDLAVWTSASQSYADLAVHELFRPDHHLKFVWSGRRCVRRFDHELMCNYDVKDLRKVKKLGYHLEKILMVDDSPEKLERNYGNHIQVRPFVGDTEDHELLPLANYLLRIANCENFRKLEKRQWRASTCNLPPSHNTPTVE